MTITTLSNAEQNARGHLDSILAAHGAVQFCVDDDIDGRYLSREEKALLHSHSYDGTNSEAVAEAIQSKMSEVPLSVEVRSGWQRCGETLEPAEYCLLLTTGGPALRLIGELNDGREPQTVTLQHQDWFKPWSDFETTSEEDDALLWFAGCFYYGE